MNKAKENTKEVSMLSLPKDNRLIFLTLKRIHSGTATAESVISFVLSAPEDQRLSCTLAHKSESWKVCHLIHFSSKSFLLYKLKRGFLNFFLLQTYGPFPPHSNSFPLLSKSGQQVPFIRGPYIKRQYVSTDKDTNTDIQIQKHFTCLFFLSNCGYRTVPLIRWPYIQDNI